MPPARAELLDERTVVMPLTVGQYHRMISEGIVAEGEPYELLDGWIVRKDRSARGEQPMTVGSGHVWVIKKLERLGSLLEPLGCHIRLQAPISLPPLDEPEPDGAIVVGNEDDYRDHHPGPTDVSCVIEVSDSSLRRDRTTKQRIYATAGIGQYIIINLADRLVEIYTEPAANEGKYRVMATARPSENLEFAAGEGGRRISAAVSSLLP